MKKFRLYFDKDKEEKWLNNICKEGFAFKKFFLGLYTFEPCAKGEYIYRIDLLQNWEGEKEDFVSFMEESGVEYICQWFRWVWLRKKGNDGEFKMYSDVESTLKQYTRIRNFFLVGFILEMLCLLVEISSFNGVINLFHAGSAILLFMLASVFLNETIKYSKKINKLKIDL